MKVLQYVLCVTLFAVTAQATIFGTIKGLIHDPQHRPVPGAQVRIQAATSDWSRTLSSDESGAFQADGIPIGEYSVNVDASGFEPQDQKVVVRSGQVANLHIALALAKLSEHVEVRASGSDIDTASSTTVSTIGRAQILQAPGADRTNSLAMVTDFVPGAYIVHDQLHVRGGHQITWLLDGIPVPNTNIATNVGPQFDPKNIDMLEVQRGGLSAEYGDRVYSVFNVVTRSGFEGDRECDLVVGYGSYNQTDDQISCGSHTERFAYFASLSGNRTDMGLETPSPDVLHDLGAGLGGFVSLILNHTPSDQLRLVASTRADHYQVPNTPGQQANGISDVEDERDTFINASWVHSGKRGVLFTVAPFLHLNRAHYIGGINDTALSPEDDHRSDYFGGVSTVSVTRGKHNARFGFEGFAQNERMFFALRGGGQAIAENDSQWGSVAALFAEDQYKPTSWLTLNGGLRFTQYSGPLGETALDPRVGAAINLPKIRWVLRGFYGRYYQAPPLTTVSGPLLDLAAQQGFAFRPLPGERDEEYEFGVSIPLHDWVADLGQFSTAARNYFDHDVLGNSNIFFPLTIERARIRGWEATIRSPRVFGRAGFHLAYSHQWAMGFGGVTGGLIDQQPMPVGGFFLDHDQRHTLSSGVSINLPWRAWISTNIAYGSGFLNGDGPDHLPAHTTADLALGKSFGESWSARFSVLNVANNHYLLDNSNTFGGTHFGEPRVLTAQIKYVFHY